MTLLQSIRHTMRTHRWKSVIVVLAVFVGMGIAFALGRSAPAEYVTADAKRGDLRQTVEAVGTVVSERGLALQFPMSGIVAQVFVREGDEVRAGQRLATLRAGTQAADVAGAAARLQSAQADLRIILEGSRPEDIAVAEAEVQNRRASLDAARATLLSAERALEQSEEKLAALEREVGVGISGQIATVGSTLTLQLTEAQNAVSSVEGVFANNDVQDAVLKSHPESLNEILNAAAAAQRDLAAALTAVGNPQTMDAAIQAIARARTSVTGAWSVVSRAFDLIANLPVSGTLTATDREAYKTTLATEKSSLQSALGTLDATEKSLRDASAGIDTRIAAEESAKVSAEGARDRSLADIRTFEASLRIAEAQLQLKRAGSRKADVDAAYARVRQEQASLQRARADLANTVLVAPIAGRITKVDIKPGELTPLDAAVSMLGQSPYRIEMFLSEIDIPKLQLTQSGSIELDAFPGVHFQLRMSEIDTAPTEVDGVMKYQAKLDFIYPHDELRIGMSGDVTVVTGQRYNVVSVPGRAVIDREDGRKVVRLLAGTGSETVTERIVETGMEGEAGDVEIRRGLAGGETVIVLEK